VVRNIATAVTAAHIHLGTVGETVPPLVGLGILGGGFPWMWHGFGEGRFDDDFFESATAQFLSGCTTGVPAATIQAIRQNPANYMVNVHTGTAIALQGPLMAKKDH
jgi:hypothetical protein